MTEQILSAEEFEAWFDTVRFASTDPKQELIDAIKQRDEAIRAEFKIYEEPKIKCPNCGWSEGK